MIQAPRYAAASVTPSAGVPALASTGLAPWLKAMPRPATVMGVSTQVAWCGIDDEVIMLLASGAARFPNAILAGSGLDHLEPGEHVLVGSGAVVGPAFEWRIVRWWDPLMTAVHAHRPEVEARVSSVTPMLPALPGLEAAFASNDPAAMFDQACSMLGAGSGLTPEGDDRLIGALASFRHVALSLGHRGAKTVIDSVAGAALAIAAERTTSLSTTLIRHAFAGEVPEPVADLIGALTGSGAVPAALERCMSLGGSSGRAMAEGVLAGARAGCGVAS